MATGANRARPAGRARALRACVLALAAATVLAAPLALASEREARDSLVGTEAPDFTRHAFGGGNFRVSEHRGDVVLLSFWTSWCGTCREQLERLARVDSTYGAAGLVVVGVSLDDDAGRAASLVKAVGARYRNVHDAAKELGRVYRVNDVPMTVLVDRSGVVRYVHGDLTRRDEEDLLKEIRVLLDE